jgi:hypothetical protein
VRYRTRRKLRRFSRAALAFVMVLGFAATVANAHNSAHAATPPTTVAYKILDAHALDKAPISTVWATKITEVNNTSGSFILSSKPDGTGDTLVRDRLDVRVDGAPTGGFGAGYEGLACAPSTPQPPPTFPEGVLSLGVHTLTATAWNKCSTAIESTDVYIVFKSASTPPPCPRVQIYGVRGSRASASDVSDTDTETSQFAKKVEGQIPGVNFTPIGYPAIPVGDGGSVQYGGNYITSVNKGYEALSGELSKLQSACPNTKVILVGYSQGAQVAGDVYESLGAAGQKRIILVMFGDPLFNPVQSRVDLPQSGQWKYNPSLRGIYQFYSPQMHLVPTVSVQNMHSYCLKGDPVCNYSKTNLVSCIRKLGACPHLRYANDGWTVAAANWAAARARALV